VASDPPWVTGAPRATPVDDSGTPLSDTPLAVDETRRQDDGVEPPPTRIHRPEALVDRPFTPPKVSPVPEIPEPGLIHSARYTVRFARARWQRRGAIKMLGADIKKDTDALDQVLGALGGAARAAQVDGRVFSGENAAITAAEQRVAQMTKEHNDVDNRKLEENAKFVEVERERNTKLGEAERMVDEAQKELAQLEAQRKGLRDKRKELERRQKAYLKAAEDNDRQTSNAELDDGRQELRRAAEQHRREAAALEPERQDIERGVAALERPITEVTARLDAAKAELDAAKRSLADAREGHTHRLAELDAEQKRKAREIAQAEAEIARRLVTLGTLVNLNRIDDPQFAELYQRIDRLRGAITARTTEIEKLSAEREAYDRGNLVRGIAAIGGAILVFIALIVILRALLR
jgi:chromosome segregation ATPase